MITAGSTTATWLFDKWSPAPPDQKVRDFVSKHYDVLRGLISNSCMKILRRLENGQNHSESELIVEVYPEYETMSRVEYDRLREEFKYRLYFMDLTGVIVRPTSEYYITGLGRAFINLARERKDYYDVLFR